MLRWGRWERDEKGEEEVKIKKEVQEMVEGMNEVKMAQDKGRDKKGGGEGADRKGKEEEDVKDKVGEVQEEREKAEESK